MALTLLSLLKQRYRLTLKLSRLVRLQKKQQGRLNTSRTSDRNNVRQSDRKFKENRHKALSARAKRANKANIHSMDRQKKIITQKLNNINSLLDNRPLGRLALNIIKYRQSFANYWTSKTKNKKSD